MTRCVLLAVLLGVTSPAAAQRVAAWEAPQPDTIVVVDTMHVDPIDADAAELVAWGALIGSVPLLAGGEWIDCDDLPAPELRNADPPGNCSPTAGSLIGSMSAAAAGALMQWVLARSTTD